MNCRRRVKGFVEVLAEVGRQDRDPVVLFHPLQEIGDLDVRVAVVRVAHFGAFAEQRVRFVEEQNRVGAFRRGEDAIEILLGLANVLADDTREIDFVEVQTQLTRDDLGGHRLARSGRPCEQRARSFAVRESLRSKPHSPKTR